MDRKSSIISFLPWFFAAILLLPWIYIQHSTSINSDVAWLSICADRLISGILLSQGCYDTNPPLSILIYAPFIFIAKILSLELHNVIFWLTFIIAIIFTAITHRTLKYLEIFGRNERFIISLSFLCAVTIIPTIYFAERDHFIAMALLPFILVQIGITYKRKIPEPLKYFTLIAGSIAILIKPHFGLIAAFIFLHRAYVNKCVIKTIKSSDFIILASLSLIYIGVVIVFFRDFIDIILPDIISLYLPHNDPNKVYLYTKLYGIIAIILFGLSFFVPKQEKRRVITVLAICAILSLAVYVIQMKGFTYHRLPFYALSFPLIFLLVYNFIKMKSLKIFMPLIFIAAYGFSPLTPDYATHNDYKNSAVLTYINANCDAPCSYFMTHENMDITSQLAFYSGHEYATRFPAFWFQPALKNEATKIRYADYIAEDLTRMSPSLLLIQRARDKDSIGFIKYYSISNNFKQAITPYKKIDSFTQDRAYFYQGTKYDFEYLLTWDVYKKDEL